MPNVGLLGVGRGVTKPDWVGRQQQRLMPEGKTPQLPRRDHVEERDARIIKQAIQSLP